MSASRNSSIDDDQHDRGSRSVDQQRDAPDGVMRERGPSDRMRLPHERDESTSADSTAAGKTPRQGELIERAGEDLASGQQDTDCRNRAPGQADCPPRPEIAKGRDTVPPDSRDTAQPRTALHNRRASDGGRR